MSDLVKELLSLPEFVEFQGIQFTLRIFKNHSYELRLCYEIDTVLNESPHKNLLETHGCWENPLICPGELHNCGFLFLVENINNEADLYDAIKLCAIFLNRHGLISRPL
jgi:hypothetical protein